QAELALEDERAAAGVDEPARLDLALLAAGAATNDRHHVRVAYLDVGDECPLEDVDARLDVLLHQEVLEPAAVELPARRRQVPRAAEFDPLGQVAVVSRAKPESQA